MHTKAQLIEIGRHYFDDKNVNVMFATPDGNFFYENCKSYADSHAKSRKIELFEIKREDLAEEAPAEKEEVKGGEPKTGETDDLAELRKEAKKLKIKGSHLMGEKRLIEEIELKNK
ncbi:hypothetical protein LCGC14_1178730 [marine sediment metagenome]|uniref:Uncharacterized protein n=1 Tax=marine sediment metagenome TaxID=412755 RepID=A0A0F9MAL9_9ZZZZ|nr:hypothetical protein [Pricia sp.]